MKFSSTQNVQRRVPRDYTSRREQYRLLLLVFALLTVFFLMQEARRPENWRWMWGSASTTPGDGFDNREDPDVDTRLVDKRSSALPAGTVVIERDVASPDTLTLDVQSLLNGQANVDLSSVRDNTVFRNSESAAWYTLLATLRDAPREALFQAPADTVGFTQLFQQPDVYRGKLVRVTGEVRRAHYVQAHKNDREIAGYWQCWMFPSGSKNPLVVYSLDMPDSFPEGMDVSEHVEFVGVSYKLWAYQAVEDILTAPLILAKTGQWQPRPAASRPTLPNRPRIAMAMVLALVLAVGTAMWVFQRSNRLSDTASRYDELRKSAPPDEPLNQLPVGLTPDEFLERLDDDSEQT